MRSQSTIKYAFSRCLSLLVAFSVFLSSFNGWAQSGAPLPVWLTTTGKIRETFEYLLRDQYEIDRNQEFLAKCLDARPQTDKEAAICREVGQSLSKSLLSSASWIKHIAYLSQTQSALPLAPSLAEKVSALSVEGQSFVDLADRLESEARIFLSDVDFHDSSTRPTVSLKSQK